MRLLALCVASAGCGTLFAPTTRPVRVTSRPPGAQVLLDGHLVGQTPGTVHVVTRQPHTVTFRLGGYQDGACALTPHARVHWIVLDALTFVVPLLVDAATGGWKEVSVNACEVSLVPMNVTDPAAPSPPPGAPP